uniref:Uncharacterized protein n=1 Tax=Dunaliella tertiolecta TaxID=3047 RepID=A0A7S3QLQ9_DUNTE|mmetsp:Transcript_1797/g.4556  ORF Transcript_1797/g.4556 Transcript_1797/m.4556 type:complete len:459 (+) Transcript_1797:34-1410(+)
MLHLGQAPPLSCRQLSNQGSSCSLRPPTPALPHARHSHAITRLHPFPQLSSCTASPGPRREHSLVLCTASQESDSSVTSSSKAEDSRPASTSTATQEKEQASPSASSRASSTSRGVEVDEPAASPRKEAQLTKEQYKEIYDRLIGVFQVRPRDDWKKLIVFSKQWAQHQSGVFDRIKELADLEEDVDKKMAMRKIFRTLQGVNDEVNRYNAILRKFIEAGSDEWDAIVSHYRGDLQRPFFEHMQCLMAASKDDKEALDKLVMMNTRLVGLCASHDSVVKDQDKMAEAAENYRQLLSSLTSVEDIDKRMAELSGQGKIDPAFLQISAKAYGAARDTNMTLDEAKWVSYKLYRHARDHFDRQQPVEKRVIEYLVSIPDPAERRTQLDNALTPGPSRGTDTHDYMWTTPNRLFLVLDNTLRAYNLMAGAAKTKLSASEESVLPRKIRLMRELRDELVRRYL